MNIEHVRAATSGDRRAFLQLITGSAGVQRHHGDANRTVYDQSVGEHTYEVLMMLLAICEEPPSVSTLVAALFHDMPETITGDLPSPIKQTLIAQGADIDGIEQEAWKGMMEHMRPAIAPLVDERADESLIKTADVLCGLLYCVHERARGNRLLSFMTSVYLEYGAAHCVTNERAWAIFTTLKDWYHELER